MADPDVIARSGVPYPTAVEIARQLNAGAGSVDRLITVGIPPLGAGELAAQISAGALSAHKLAAAMWNPVVAKSIVQYSGAGSASGLAGLKTKLIAGQNAKMLIVADSTGHSTFGPYFKMAAALASRYPSYNVRIYRWGEWLDTDTVSGSGPKAYDAGTVIASGGGSTLTIYLASLPGSVPGGMFDGSRKPAAIDAVGTPDVIVWHHGHNNAAFAGNIWQGRGTFIGPMGMMSETYSSPQILVAQNPWRDSNGYLIAYNAIVDTIAAYAGGVGLIDAYTPYINAGKDASLYRLGVAGNVHPSDDVTNSAGAQMTCDAIMAAFNRAGTLGIVTPNWVRQATLPNLLVNGDFSAWPAAVPTSWSASGSATTTKNTTLKYGSATYSNDVKGVSAASNIQNLFSGAPLTALKGKTLSFCMLVYNPSVGADPFSTTFVIRVGGASQTIQLKDLLTCRDGWMMYVAAGIPADATQTDFAVSVKIDPNFNNNAPGATAQTVARASIVEGLLPMGFVS